MSNVVSRSRQVITLLSTQCLWALTFNNALGLQFKDIEKLERTQCRAAVKSSEVHRSGGEAEGAVLVYAGEKELKGDPLGVCNYMKWQRWWNQTLHRWYRRHCGQKLPLGKFKLIIRKIFFNRRAEQHWKKLLTEEVVSIQSHWSDPMLVIVLFHPAA